MTVGIEIVTHCYSGDEVPIYHKLLVYQLSSLLVNHPKIYAKITVCYTGSDRATEKVLNYFSKRFRMRNGLWLKYFPMPADHLFRRAIGRNRVALESEADVVWFTDVDHVFGKGCLETAYHLATLAFSRSQINMVFPETVNIHKSHDLGDILLRPDELPCLQPIDASEFEPRKEKRAWGGLQIVRGDWCREHGYLDGTKWQTPVDPAHGFKSCKCDVPFRKAVGPSKAVSIPNLYRIRHSRAGRDGGAKDHGEKTRV